MNSADNLSNPDKITFLSHSKAGSYTSSIHPYLLLSAVFPLSCGNAALFLNALQVLPFEMQPRAVSSLSLSPLSLSLLTHVLDV
jgi:hypothetical protein